MILSAGIFLITACVTVAGIASAYYNLKIR